MKPFHKACRSEVIMLATDKGSWYCKHCTEFLESYEVIKPVVRLGDNIYVNQYKDKEMATLMINAISTLTGPTWL